MDTKEATQKHIDHYSGERFVQLDPGFCLMSVLPYPGGGVGGWVWQNFRVGGCPTPPPPPGVGWDFVGALGLLSQCHFFLSSVAGSV